MFGILRWHTLERLFCFTSAGLERMKHVLGRRLKRPSARCIRSTPGRDWVRGLSETSEKCAKVCFLNGIRPSCSWILAYAELEQKKPMGKHLFPSWPHFQTLASYSVPTTLFSKSHLEAFGLLSYDCYVFAFRYQISRLNTFVRAFVVSEEGRSLPNDTIRPSVRADSSS